MEVICLETSAFYALVREVVDQIREEYSLEEWRWVGKEEAKRLLGIRSDNTLQELRNNGKIRFSQVSKKVIHYDRESIAQLLEDNANERF